MHRAFAIFALLLALPAAAAPAKAPAKLHVGEPAPQFVRNDLAGKPFDLKAQRGKIVLIDFWASWCPPCIEEIPHLNRLQNKYGGHFQAVGIAMDDSVSVTKETMRKISFGYPVVPGDAKFGNLYGGVLGLPLQYLVGADGKILAIWSGEVAPATLEKEIGAAVKNIRPG
ncbi:MAG TPA: TlpA disulfide reductase family protein [Bryobacteraceae bacterium]|nr:TlpA disulfide reductase family protein [Bryobacteraceae bacterium]